RGGLHRRAEPPAGAAAGGRASDAARPPAACDLSVTVAVETGEGVYTIDAETEQVVDFVAGAELSETPAPRVELPLLVAAAAEGSTVVAVLDRRPPLAVSNDAGSSWREAGGGLPPGRAIAIAENDPDRMLYAAE